MEYLEITNDTQLHYCIMKLNYLREEQEIAVKRNAKELVYSIHPSEILRNITIEILSGNKEGNKDLKSIGLGLGRDFLIMKLFKSRTVKSFITSLIVKKIMDYAINNPDSISDGINKLENYFSDFNKERSED